MKKYIVGLVSFILFGFVFHTVFADITTTLKISSRDTVPGGEVTMLQQFLKAKGYFTYEADGHFGKKTAQAVKAFQIENNLKADGSVGFRTRIALNAAMKMSTPNPTLNTQVVAPTTSTPVTTPHLQLDSSESGVHPSRPTGLLATAGSCGTNSISLSWNAQAGINQYNYFRSATNGRYYTLIGSVSNQHSVVDSFNLSPGVKYYYVVEAVSPTSVSANSNQGEAIAPGSCIPSAPTGLNVSPGLCNQMNLSWSASVGATEYNVLRSTIDGSGFTIVNSSPVVVPKFVDTNVPQGDLYYVVQAKNDKGVSSNSTQIKKSSIACQ